MIKYSFIIPHYNTPVLLERCVNSIPQREDIQIIVVDDNSDTGKKPENMRADVEVVLLDVAHSKGAGHARNVGIERAQGKWLLFADADDFYREGFLNYLDEHSESPSDVIYFSTDSVNTKTLEPLARTQPWQSLIKEYDGSVERTDAIKYKLHAPWNKMIRAEFISKYRIRFEEVLQGNDAMFSYLVGYFATDIEVIPSDLYTYTYTENSITTRKKNKSMYLCTWENYFKQRQFLSFVGTKQYSKGFFQKICYLHRRYGFTETIKALFLLLTNIQHIYNVKNTYINACLKNETC